VFSSRKGYQDFRRRLSPIVEKVQSEDDGFYRMEKTVHRKTNDPYLLNMNGLSGSTSTLNEETILLLNEMGLCAKSHWTKYLGGTPVFDSLFGVKYLITENYESAPLYEELYTYNDDLTAYRNNYALPIAYAVDKSVMKLDITGETGEMYSPFERMNAMVSAMLGEEDVEIFKEEYDYTEALLNLKKSSIASHSKFAPMVEGSVARVTYTINISDSDTLYCYFPSDYIRECQFYVNDEHKGTYYGNETYRIVEVGNFQVGDVVTVTLQLADDVLYIREDMPYFCYCDSEAFKEYMPQLAENGYNITKHTDTSFEGTISVTEERDLIFTTIAYDEGWNIYLDGKKVEPVKALGGLLAFYAEPGDHQLTMKYCPDVLILGSIISACGVIIFAGIWTIDAMLRRRYIEDGREVFEVVSEIEIEFFPIEEEITETTDAPEEVEEEK
jgi:uncharacterized membrane protein YfhO